MLQPKILKGSLNFLQFNADIKSLLFFLLTIISFGLKAQISLSDSIFLNRDAIETFQSQSTLDPNRAAFLSAVLPGLGQAYNNQYWKIPLIYGGGIAIGHYINYNNKLYYEFDNALRKEIDGDASTVNPYAGRFSQSALERNREAFRRNRDLLIIIAAAYYLLNVMEAHVSAHLHEFVINENLSVNIDPSIQSTPLFSHAVGFSVSLSIK